MDRTVKYGKVANVVVLIFPDEDGAKDFITRIETQNLLSKIQAKETPVAPLKPTLGTSLKPRIVA